MLQLLFGLGIVAVFPLNQEVTCQTEFSYKDVLDWPQLFQKYCDGISQSPINIDDRLVRNQYMKILNLTEYVQKPISTLTLTNNGHTVQGSFQESIVITGGPAGIDKFKLQQFHFHFGKGTNDGSEHKVNGQQYALEIHFVHLNLKYRDMATAIQNKDGILVIGVIGLVDDRSTMYSSSPLTLITDNLVNVQNFGQTTSIKGPIYLSKLLPRIDSGFDYYTYSGSLTTPNCNQAVIWVINNQPLRISSAQLKKFAILKNEEGEPMSGNVRPVQNLNSRPIFYVPS